jgi:hypothetical protein
VALTNIEKQARWRERHADRRHAVARIATMLTRQRFSDGITHEVQVGWNTCTIDGYFLNLAKLICTVLKTDRAIKQLRWALAKCLRDRKAGTRSRRAIKARYRTRTGCGRGPNGPPAAGAMTYVGDGGKLSAVRSWKYLPTTTQSCWRRLRSKALSVGSKAGDLLDAQRERKACRLDAKADRKARNGELAILSQFTAEPRRRITAKPEIRRCSAPRRSGGPDRSHKVNRDKCTCHRRGRMVAQCDQRRQCDRARLTALLASVACPASSIVVTPSGPRDGDVRDAIAFAALVNRAPCIVLAGHGMHAARWLPAAGIGREEAKDIPGATSTQGRSTTTVVAVHDPRIPFKRRVDIE